MAVTIGQGIKITQGISIAPSVFAPPPPTDIVRTGLQLYLNASIGSSYSPSNPTTWSDLSGLGNDVGLRASSPSDLIYTASPGYLTPTNNSYFYNPGGTIPTGNDNYTIGVVARVNWANNPGFMCLGPAYTPANADSINAMGTPTGEIGLFNNYWWSDDLLASNNDGNLDNTNFFYILATFDGSTRTLYANGVNVGSDTPSGTHNVSSSEIFVGIGEFTNANYLNGDIAAVTVYNQALSPADIATNLAYFQSIYGF